MKYKIQILAILSIIFFSSQVKKTPRRIKIEEEVEKRVQQFRQSKNDRCAQKVMDRAIEIVDSTLLIQAKVKMSNVVERPEKPEKPEIKKATDTEIVEPIF